ncbi:MAG TPA: glycoside hydrolase family 19 protein, partial [Chryseobacterium sp.]
MSDFKIIGNPNPEIGKEIIYKTSNSDHVSLLPGQISPVGINPFAEQIKWSVYILEFGKWILKEKNNKTGPTANYTFTEKSLKRQGIRIVARLGEEKAILDIKPQDTIERKIVKVELCDALGNLQTKPFAYNQTVLAKVHCLNLNDCTVHVTLWEDDAPGAGHSETNKNNKAVTKSERVSNGVANVKFKLAVDFAKIANAHLAGGDKSEGKTHEYYVTAEVFRQKTQSSNN